MNFAGRPLEINRMLGFCDLDDPSNLPVGLAAICRNADFGLTSVMTRAGINMEAAGVAAGIQGINQSPITGLMGLLYNPENSSQNFFQLPLLFDMAGSLQGEFAVGGGRAAAISSSTFVPPASSHMIGAQAYNKAWLAFSNLITPQSGATAPTPGMGVLNLQTLKYGDQTKALDPYGMKPYGWTWTAGTKVVVGEVCTPTPGNVNGHTFRCTTAGITGASEPAWTTTGSATYTDGTAVWTEATLSAAIVYPAYPPPLTWTATFPDSGDWPIGPDGNELQIYFVATYVTTDGETDVTKALIGLEEPSGSWYTGSPATGKQSYTFNLAAPPSAPPGFTGNVPTGWNLYIAFAPAGTTSFPPSAAFEKWNPTPNAFATPIVVRNQNLHGAGPRTNTAKIVGAGNIDTWQTVDSTYIAAPGAGYSNQFYQNGVRYASVLYVNRNFTVSGFTQASAVPVRIYYNGSTLNFSNIPEGPDYVIARIIIITELQFDPSLNYWDPNGPPNQEAGSSILGQGSLGTNAGPYFWIGNFVPGPNYFAFPQTTLSDGLTESATLVGDNTTITAYFSYTDSYLISSNSATDRLRVIWPYPCVDIYYSPTNDRMIQTGVPGFNGHWISLAADPESYYVDSGFVPTSSASGERAICAREFRGQLYSLRERSGFTMTLVNVDDLGNPTWDVQQRWDKIGPCGPRAVDVCGRFMIFVHRSGIYKYDQEEPEPVLVSKEIPYWWQDINWNFGHLIWCAIDEEKSVVRIGVPVGESVVPNQEILLYYKEGWNTPIHFSTYSGHEISMDSARRYAINDVSAYLGLRIERAIPNPSPIDQGDEGIMQLDSGFFTSQFLYASSGPTGSVPAITPGIWHDGNTAQAPAVGIDFHYETMSAGTMLPYCRLEGFSVNARGNGQMFCAFIAGRHMLTDWDPAGSPPSKDGVVWIKRPIDLVPNQHVGDSRMVPSGSWGERWRLHFTNRQIPDAWMEIKYAIMYSVPFSDSRPQSASR